MKLLTLDHQGISDYVDQLEEEVNAIKENALHLTWAMRGGVQYMDVLNMSKSERKMIKQLAKDNLETTKNTRLPFF